MEMYGGGKVSKFQSLVKDIQRRKNYGPKKAQKKPELTRNPLQEALRAALLKKLPPEY